LFEAFIELVSDGDGIGIRLRHDRNADAIEAVAFESRAEIFGAEFRGANIAEEYLAAVFLFDDKLAEFFGGREAPEGSQRKLVIRSFEATAREVDVLNLKCQTNK